MILERMKWLFIIHCFLVTEGALRTEIGTISTNQERVGSLLTLSSNSNKPMRKEQENYSTIEQLRKKD